MYIPTEYYGENPVRAGFYEEKPGIDGKILRFDNYSYILGSNRTVDVYLPPGYNKYSAEQYPVIYMHDGNNLFFPGESFGNVCWDVHNTIENLLAIGYIREVIVVAIHNTVGRNTDYTWYKGEYWGKMDGGGGATYAGFIVKELKPFIDGMFKTSRRREDTAVIGSSLGGLISFYLGLYYPHIFANIGAMSPSFWWSNFAVYNHAEHISTDLKIWMDMGTAEKAEEHISHTRQMLRILLKRGFEKGRNVIYLEDKGAEHNEFAWGKRLHFPLLYFFGRK